MSPGGEVTLNATKFLVNAPQSEFSAVVTAQGQINGNGGMAVQGGDGAEFIGDVRHHGGKLSSNGVVVDEHTHSGVQSGSDNTGNPNK